MRSLTPVLLISASCRKAGLKVIGLVKYRRVAHSYFGAKVPVAGIGPVADFPLRILTISVSPFPVMSERKCFAGIEKTMAAPCSSSKGLKVFLRVSYPLVPLEGNQEKTLSSLITISGSPSPSTSKRRILGSFGLILALCSKGTESCPLLVFRQREIAL